MDKRWRIAAVAGPVMAFTLTSQYEIWVGPLPLLHGTVSGPRPVVAAIAATISLGLGLRLRFPILAVVVGMSLMGLHPLGTYLFGPGSKFDLLELFVALEFMVYSTAFHTNGTRSNLAAAIIIAYQLLNLGASPSLAAGVNESFGGWVFFTIAWALGKTVRHRDVRGDRLQARTVELEEQSAQLIQSAIAEERARIARELHDVVAHSVSLMVLQAGAARQALDRHPEKAREPLLSVEATGRSAMSELRRLVTMLRQPGDEDELAPQPSLRHLDLLVGQMREAGLAVELAAEGSLEAIPPGIDLSAYRIAQEALTNVLKHAGATHVELHVRCDGKAVEVAVEDDGRGRVGAGAVTGGHGLIGMRERVNLFGGCLEAGPRDGGGFRVYARLPYESA